MERGAENLQRKGEQPAVADEGNAEQAVAHPREYVEEVELELQKIYDGIVALMDEPVVLQKQAPTIQEVLKTIEFTQVQYVDEIVDEPVVMQGQVPTTQTVKKTVDASRVQFPDRVVNDPVGMQVPVTQERIVEVTDVPVPRVMEETAEVETLKSQRSKGESTLLADNKFASKLDGGCAAQAPEWKELRGLRDEELVTIRDINKLLDDYNELIPEWLNSVKGVVDSEELPLNIYRETLQQNEILRLIKMNLAKKYLEMLAEIAELNDDYKKFYEQFVKCMKLGIHENSVDGVEIAELLRFNTSKPGDEQISFEEYVDRMKEGQNDICYIT